MSGDVFEKACTDSGAQYFRIAGFDDRYPVRTFFTSKNGGVSDGCFASLNMGFSTGDDRSKVEENRRRMFDFIGEESYCEVAPHQVHRAEIACIRAEDIVRLEEIQEGDVFSHEMESSRVKRGQKLSFPDTDAAVTDVSNVILTSLHADCLPVWLYDPKRHAAGLAHAGWRGTRADIAANTALKMCGEFGCHMEDIRAVIGPGISKCCFEVGPEVVEEFSSMLGEDVFFGSGQTYVIDDQNGKYHLDLKAVNRELLLRAGIKHIDVTAYCTCCSDDLFYSYRRDGGTTGRMCAGIMLLPAVR